MAQAVLLTYRNHCVYTWSFTCAHTNRSQSILMRCMYACVPARAFNAHTSEQLACHITGILLRAQKCHSGRSCSHSNVQYMQVVSDM
jgi:hypothetical protein